MGLAINSFAIILLIGFVNGQMFFDKVMNYNTKAQEYLDSKHNTEKAASYPPKKSAMLDLEKLLKQQLDIIRFKTIAQQIVDDVDDQIKTLKVSQLLDVQFFADQRALYQTRLQDLKWKDERVKKLNDDYMQEIDIISQRVSQAKQQKNQAEGELQRQTAEYDKLLQDADTKLQTIVETKNFVVDALESEAEDQIYEALSKCKQIFIPSVLQSKRKNPQIPTLQVQIDKLLQRRNYAQDKKTIYTLLPVILNFLSETQVIDLEDQLELELKKYENLGNLEVNIGESEQAGKSHDQYMRMIKDKIVNVRDEIQLTSINMRDIEKEINELQSEHDKLFLISDSQLYYLRENKKDMVNVRNDNA